MTSSPAPPWTLTAAEDGFGGLTTTELLLALGLPMLLIVVGTGVFLWGRRERAEARAELGVKGGFGGPPGTTDIGNEIGFGVEGPGPDPNAGGGRILGGLVCLLIGLLALAAGLVWTVLS
jgi:hypothetical protein